MTDSDERLDPDTPQPLPLDSVLDLHTFSLREIGSLIPDWIDACRAAGLRELRIVHGKGAGTLRRAVHALLDRRETSNPMRSRQSRVERGAPRWCC